MRDEINKFLTDAMGDVWHEVVLQKQVDFTTPIHDYSVVCTCGKTGYSSEDRRLNDCYKQTDFFTPDGFFKIWNWAQEKRVGPENTRLTYMALVGRTDGKFCRVLDEINPERFATAVHDFLKEVER